MHSSRNIKMHKIILIVIFISLLIVPMAGKIFNPGSPYHIDERMITDPLPEFPGNMIALNRFPGRFDKYINDNFGYRVIFTKLHSLLKFNLLKVSTIPDVVLGSIEGWLFYNGGDVLGDYQGKIILSENELEKYRMTLEGRYFFLKKMGIKYLVVIPPNKLSVYPNYGPKWLIKGKTRLEQITEYMKEKRSPVKIIYLKEALMKKRNDTQLYIKADTHWNMYGAYYAGKEVSENLRIWYPQIPQFQKLDEYPITEKIYNESDLPILMGVDVDKYFSEKIPSIEENTIKNISYVNFEKFYSDSYQNDIAKEGLFIYKNTNKKLPRAVVFHDSFMLAMKTYMMHNFSRAVFHWQTYDKIGFDPAIVKHERPDIVIQECLERLIVFSISNNPEEIKQR